MFSDVVALLQRVVPESRRAATDKEEVAWVEFCHADGAWFGLSFLPSLETFAPFALSSFALPYPLLFLLSLSSSASYVSLPDTLLS